MNSKEQQEIPEKTSIPDKKLRDARQVIKNLILAWRNYGLYPEDHVSTQKSFENLVTSFGDFFASHGDLRLTVEKDCLLCDSEPVHEISATAPSEDIITLLYRDGIKWIEFQEGLTPNEFASFFRITYKYRSLAEEIEGDIVTSLMDEELEHIDFKAVDIFWQDLMVMDFSQLVSPGPVQEEIADQNSADQAQDQAGAVREDTYARSIADPSITAQLKLSAADFQKLEEMVTAEEGWNITEDLLELLLLLLRDQTEQEKFTAILLFISEIAVETIEQDKFNLLVKLFESLYRLFSLETAAEQDVDNPVIDRFSQVMFKPETFKLISTKLLQLPATEIEKLSDLGRALHYFPPEVVPFLLPVILKRNSPEIQQVVSEVIIALSERDIGPLEKCVGKYGKEKGEKLLDILNTLHGDRANEILYGMCEHPSDKVRRKAIKELLDRDPQYAQRLFSLIDEPDNEVIRTHILAAFAKQRSSAVENMLLDYLEKNSAQDDQNHILACYKALGRCGSNASVPFLRRTLLDRGWNSFMGTGKSVYREGAAIALALIDTPPAKSVLLEASKSNFKVVREAFARSKAITVFGENTNEL